ncbi:hypothetical protein [uncultured Desulfovibrio sp.]|uniref:hypothetical protein n=1 Tax=uncultured Desulfovibrio sp. TaxID=167968 RepID=UPI00265CB0F2|nr:hypothetical protein [uncultured Desulfovibrio sp.]
MQRISLLSILLLSALLLCPRATVAEEIKTDSFTLTIPQGWQKHADRTEGNVYVLMLHEPTENLLLNIIIGPALVPVKTFVERYKNKFEQGGFTCSGIMSQGEACIMEFSSRKHHMHGLSYAASNGHQSSITIFMASEKDAFPKLREFMKTNFKPLDPKLFPRTF